MKILRCSVLALLTLLLSSGLGAAESASMLLSPDGQFIYTANFDGGSITRISRTNPKQRQELQLGKDLQRLALSADGRDLLVSDMLAGRVYLVDAHRMKLRESIAVGRRPFGILYDSRHDWFWVTLFEDHRLIALDREGRERVRIAVEETPRGLARTSDGRLLVSHAMIGKISLFDVTGTTPRLLKLIALAETQDADEFVAQGLPRLLDDIALAPDESEAWLPHVLWNFDHPFQFQSTIFPAVSVLDLTPGAEAERLSDRKMLFKQINIIDNANRTRILSNPQDAAFSPDGAKVYVTAAGSEDLLVFDRARSGNERARSKRRQGKLDQGGAQVTQILRHLPGANPRGLVVDGGEVLVQNAMSLDLTLVDRGGDSPFARATVKAERWAVTVAQDPLPPALRAGAALFHRGNTGRDARTPMTGDFWMSCNSCHLDGFNFTNRYLMEAHNPADKTRAVTGHGNLKTMIAAGFIADYIRIIQDTQGGLGHDRRDGALAIDPEHPPEAVAAMMNELHAFVTAPQNLPYLSTWLRLDSDRRYAHPDEWLNSATCQSCHSEIFDQWVDSNHRLMGESNPYYRVMEDFAAATEGEAFRAWCVGCHNPQRTTLGLPFRGPQNHMFEQGGESLVKALDQQRHTLEEGTSCLFCHRITQLEDAGGNAAFTVNLEDREQYLFENSNQALVRWLGERQINAKPAVHAASYRQEFYKDSLYCKSCHDEFSPGLGAKIVGTYGEWEKSSFNAPDDPSKNRTCIDCHMHADIARIGEPVPGRSTEGGRLKNNVATHQFTGANHHLLGLRNDKLEQMSIELLKSSATLAARLEQDALVVRVTNVGAGHALPTGVADFRELWIQVQVWDASGNLILASGKPDAQGNLPADTRLFMKVFGDENGEPLGLRFWRYAKLLRDTRIPADGYRDERFELPPDAAFPLKVETRLLFRIYPQWVTDLVQTKVPELHDPPIVELNRLESRFAGRP